ncbi:MAG: hypothetical protein LBL00_01820 [Endomicrobium sp.]|jgi:hypothetical protein|nr:hypothetical protein [Endomicrobium sp.]
MIKKIIFSFIICMSFYCILNSQAMPSNIGRQVYSIFSDIYLGASWSASNDDGISARYLNCKTYNQTYDNSSNIIYDIESSPYIINNAAQAWEGSKYITFTAGGNQAFFITFKGNTIASNIGTRDMSAYYGGTIEFYVKDINNTDATRTGIRIGSNTDRIGYISDFGFNSSKPSGEWQKLTMRLTSSSYNGGLEVTQNELKAVSSPFLIHLPSNNNKISVDSILWVKPQPVLNSKAFKLSVKNNANNSSAGKITWSTSTIIPGVTAWVLSDQYIELDGLDYYKDGWSVQIYTDNKSLNASSPVYTGNITKDTNSGMVGVYNPDKIIPIRWRTAKASDLVKSLYDENWQEPWEQLRDISAFSDPSDRGDERIKFFDKRGYKWNAVQRYYGDLPPDKKIRIYFLADMRHARKGFKYKTSSIIFNFFIE